MSALVAFFFVAAALVLVPILFCIGMGLYVLCVHWNDLGPVDW